MTINFENIPRQMKEEGKFCLHENKFLKKGDIRDYTMQVQTIRMTFLLMIQ